jgi:hypothetical protein
LREVKNGEWSLVKCSEVKWCDVTIFGEMCVFSLIYSYVAVCMFCAVRCVIIICFYLLLSKYSTYVVQYSFYVCFLLYFCFLFCVFCVFVCFVYCFSFCM